jgi:uncharacterized repeat protein (TIGR02543 family)
LVETVTLTITVFGGGNTSPPPGTYQYNKGSTVTLKATPSPGYSFLFWVINGVTKYDNPATITLNSDTIADAHFTYPTPPTPPATYTLTISATDGGTTEPSPSSYTYPAGTTVTVKAIPNSGYTFNHWELDGANVGPTNPITITMDSNHNLHAVFSAAPTPPPTPPPTKPSILPILAAIGVGALIIGGLYYLVAKS